MHFRIVDLLLATTLAAVYAAGASLLTPPTDATASAALLLSPMAIMPLTVIGLSVASRRRLGRAAVNWRRRHWWAPHAAFVALFFVGAVWSRWAEVPISILLPSCVAHHVLFFAMTPIALGDAGLLLGTTLLRHRNYAMQLDETKGRLRWRGRPGRGIGLFHQSRGDVGVPSSKLPAAREALSQIAEADPA
ncbi:MAG: hypothetical protein AAF805_13425 [Planctomycetota bacterium]